MATSGSKKRASHFDFQNSSSKKGHWSQGLLKSMNDPKLLIEKDDTCVIIKDKFPKARYHFLVLPLEHIETLKVLKADHIPLLHHLETKAKELAKKYPHTEFRYGYHAIPSMAQIHLHMISQDFDSPSLKTKKHWNSFTTPYFMDSSDVVQSLEETGSVSFITPEAGRKFLEQPLTCHKCPFKPSNMPKLKLHLEGHCSK